MSSNNLPELEFISWTQFHRMGFELSQQIKELRSDLDQIVSISRGGHVLSRILSDFLGLAIFSVSIQSYSAMQQHEIEITQEIAPELIKRHVLLVDEIVDTGRTLERANEYLTELGAETITSVSLHVKPKATPKPDFYVSESSKWVVYPYEVRETIEALRPKWEKAGLSQTDMLYELTKHGMNEMYAQYFLEQTKS